MAASDNPCLPGQGPGRAAVAASCFITVLRSRKFEENESQESRLKTQQQETHNESQSPLLIIYLAAIAQVDTLNELTADTQRDDTLLNVGSKSNMRETYGCFFTLNSGTA